MLAGWWEGSRYNVYHHFQHQESLPSCLMHLPDPVGRAISNWKASCDPGHGVHRQWLPQQSEQCQLLQSGKNPKDLGMNSTSREKDCWRKIASLLGFFMPTLGKAQECPVSVAAKSSQAREQLSSHTHVQTQPGSSQMLRQGSHSVRNTEQQLPFPSGSTGKVQPGPCWTRGTQHGNEGLWGREIQWPAREQEQDYRNAVNTTCIQKRSVCGRQLRRGMRVSVINMGFSLFPLQNPKPVCQRAKHKVLFAPGPLVHCCSSTPGM